VGLAENKIKSNNKLLAVSEIRHCSSSTKLNARAVCDCRAKS
jgi:hypothetical protein